MYLMKSCFRMSRSFTALYWCNMGLFYSHVLIHLSIIGPTSHDHSTTSRLINTVTVVTRSLRPLRTHATWKCSLFLDHCAMLDCTLEIIIVIPNSAKVFHDARLMNGFSIADNNEQMSQCLSVPACLTVFSSPNTHRTPNVISHHSGKTFPCIQRICFEKAFCIHIMRHVKAFHHGLV